MIVSTATALKIGGVVLAAGLLIGWVRERDSRLRAEGRAEVLAERVDSLRAVADSALMAVASKDSTVAIQRTVIETQQKHLEEISAVARRQTQVAVNSLRETLDSAQRDMLDQIEAGYNSQLAAKDSMFAAQVRLTRLAQSQVAERDNALAKVQQASGVVYEAWQQEKQRASPSIVTKALRLVPVVVTTIGVTLAVAN